MNAIEFFEKLGVLYTADDDESAFEERIGLYADLLDKKLKESKKIPDFDSTIEFITAHYPYRAFPTYNYIWENLKYKKPSKIAQKDKSLPLRGFRVQTNYGIYDFWEYVPYDEKVESVRGFKVLEEL